jgi:hypothetical protein
MLRGASVVIPYAIELQRAIPDQKPEARRVIKQLFGVIEVVALLHQFQREQDDNGNIVATLDDYGAARRLLAQPLGESLGASNAEKTLYGLLLGKFGKGGTFTTKEAIDVQNAAEQTTRKHLAALRKLSCVEQLEGGAGRGGCAKWTLVRSPDESFLPSPEALGG